MHRLTEHALGSSRFRQWGALIEIVPVDVLGEFARERLATLDAGELDQFEALMDENDRDLLSWFTREIQVPAAIDTAVFRAILSHCLEKTR